MILKENHVYGPRQVPDRRPEEYWSLTVLALQIPRIAFCISPMALQRICDAFLVHGDVDRDTHRFERTMRMWLYSHVKGWLPRSLALGEETDGGH